MSHHLLVEFFCEEGHGMTKYREVLRMSAGGFSQRVIASTLSISRNTVASTLKRAREQNLDWEAVEQQRLSEKDIANLLFPDRKKESPYQIPDFEYMAKELKKTGVSLQMLWLEYCEGCRSSGKRPYMYSQYCELFRRNMRKNQATMTIPRTPGERVEVDWAGKTGSLKDPVTGDIIPVYIFVAAMSYSQYCYAEGFLNMDLESWIDAHIHLFEFLGGVPKTVVPDNLKTGVTKVFWVEPEIQNNYQEMAEHYNTFIMPARVKRPRDKSVAEGAVGKFANTLLGKVRNQTFFTVEEFNETLIHYLDSYNSHQFQKKLGSRATLFAEEIDLLTPLPKQRYELATWRTATVQPNYHVAVHKMFYSVPFQYISKKLQVKTTRSMVEIYDGDTRICSHLRLEGRSGQYRTRPEHMPDKHQKYLQWDEKRFMNWAAQYGPSTEAVIRALLASHAIPQHGFRGCLAILKLPGKHEGTILEQACAKALTLSQRPSYKVVKRIYKTIKEQPATESAHPSEAHAFIRNLGKE
jgi:transposase